LRGTNGPKFGNKIILSGLFQGSELISIRVRQMLEIERAGYSVFEVLHWGQLITGQAIHQLDVGLTGRLGLVSTPPVLPQDRRPFTRHVRLFNLFHI
jgi:hypothetical protein